MLNLDFDKYLKNCPCGSKKRFAECRKPKRLDNILKFSDDPKQDARPDWRIAVISKIFEDVPPTYAWGPSHKTYSVQSSGGKVCGFQAKKNSFRGPRMSGLDFNGYED
jgi:hypothetical protein